jgi:DNA mismatch repair protein MSH3
VENLHMGYKEDVQQDGSRDVVFLYKLTLGITTESFGVECGRLAGLPEVLLQLAASKSRSLKQSVEAREKRNRCVIDYSLKPNNNFDVHLQDFDGY